MRGYRVRSYAKINLALEVLGRRPDGFHELVSVTQTISLHDIVDCEPADVLRVETQPPLVAEADNLARRAAELLAARIGRPPGGTVKIQKRIPLAAGLGGGSSNAAAALRVLARLWSAPVSLADLVGLGARLGSDVPLFLIGGAALIRGRGERVEPLGTRPRFWVALACPRYDVPNKTAALYRALAAGDWSDGRWTEALAARLGTGRSPVGLPTPNAFDRAASQVYPAFEALRERLGRAAGRPVQLTGAGPSLYALFDDRWAASAAAARMAALGVDAFVARPVGRALVRVVELSADRAAAR